MTTDEMILRELKSINRRNSWRNIWLCLVYFVLVTIMIHLREIKEIKTEQINQQTKTEQVVKN